jgi:hypothetical protein
MVLASFWWVPGGGISDGIAHPFETEVNPSDGNVLRGTRLKLVRAIAFWFGYGRMKARNEYQALVTQYPDEESVQSIRPLFYDTSKKEFLRQW